MARPLISRLVIAAIAGVLLLGGARAQDIEPRAYSNAPVGVNFLIGALAFSRGGLSFDPSSPLSEPQLKTTNTIFGYARVLDLWGKSGKFDVIVSQTWLSGTARYLGQAVEREVRGPIDPKFRLSINLLGAPALGLKDFASYEQDLIVGASLQVSAPWGQYDRTRLANIGTNRWSFKPEIGLSKVVGPWTLELAGAATFYTDNDDFFNGGIRSQESIYSVQAHAIYAWRSGVWGALDATYFAGGRTTLNGVLGNDLQRNWRLGGTLAFPVDRHHSLKLYASSGVSSRTGNDFDLLGIAWQYRWGGGL